MALTRLLGTSRRRPLAIVAALVGLVVVVLLVARLAGGGPAVETPTAGPTADPAAAAPATTPATASPDEAGAAPTPGSVTPSDPPPDEPAVAGPAGELAEMVEGFEAGQEHLPPVEAGEIAHVGDGVTVSVDGAERIEAQASGPGEVAGPAVALTVTFTNGGTDTLTLDDVVVNLYGQEGVPGVQFTGDPRRRPLAGELTPNGRSTGTYVFSVPSSNDGPLIVSVSVGVDVPTPLFTMVLEES